MFHSSGYFRGVFCPFFEHGLCHRPHCHYKHSKPGSTKQTAKLVLNIHPKLHSTLNPTITQSKSKPEVKKLDQPTADQKIEDTTLPGGKAADSVQDEVSSKESMITTVPEVVDAIGQISNYFGSTAPGQSKDGSELPAEKPSGEMKTAEQDVRSNDGTGSEVVSGDVDSEGRGLGSHVEDNTAIGNLSKETIGRLAGQIAEQLSGNASSKVAGTGEPELPSYAPEKCIASDGGYTREKEGKVSHLAQTTGLGLGDLEDAGSAGDVISLQKILVSEKDIFGYPLPKEDDDDDADDNHGGHDNIEVEEPSVGPGESVNVAGGGAMGISSAVSDHYEAGTDDLYAGDDLDFGADEEPVGGDGKSTTHGTSEAEMMAEFNKLTSLNVNAILPANPKKKKVPTATLR